MIGWAIGDDEPGASIPSLNDDDERRVLGGFWQHAKHLSPLIGFNILDFDLRVILVRSALLGVRPTRLFDTRPWGKDIVDLMKLRFPTGKAMGLKKLARLYGFPEGPVDDVDGSQVSELMHTNPEKLAEYCKSDIVKIRQLYKFYCGYFCEGPAIVGSAERAFW
jgi:predicted PolB exonuclease-like 3'-5' exonuclease